MDDTDTVTENTGSDQPQEIHPESPIDSTTTAESIYHCHPSYYEEISLQEI